MFGRRTADHNKKIIAFVQPRAGAAIGAEEVSSQPRDLIAPYKRPQRIVLIDALPLGSTGKIWKMKLAEMAQTLPTSE